MRWLMPVAMLAVSCSAPWVPDWLRDKGPIHYNYDSNLNPFPENHHAFPSLRARDAGVDAGLAGDGGRDDVDR
jgi:hypothetical protein